MVVVTTAGSARRWVAGVSFVVLLVVLLAACGGSAHKPTADSSTAVTSTTTPSRRPAANPVPLRPGQIAPPSYLWAISFPTSQLGFGVITGTQNTDGGVPGTVPAQLVASTDGGSTWRAIGGLLPYAGGPSVGGVSAAQLAFATGSLGYTWDQAQVDLTADAGVHWQTLPDPPGATATDLFIGPTTLVGTTLWVSYTTACGNTTGCPSRIAAWTPGAGWTLLLAQGTTVAALTAADSEVEALVTLPAKTSQPADRARLIEHSTIGARTGWRQAAGTLDCPADSSMIDSMAAISATQIVAECVNAESDDPAWKARSYWLTTNRGATWTLRARAIGNSVHTPGAYSGSPQYTVGTPPRGQSGYLAVGAGQLWNAVSLSTLYSSADQGLHWHAGIAIPADEGLIGIVTFDGQHGWCVYHGLGLWRTTNGGSTWQQLGPSNAG